MIELIQVILGVCFVGIGAFMLFKEYVKDKKQPEQPVQVPQSAPVQQRVDSSRLVCLQKLDELMDCVDSKEVREYLAKNVAPSILLKK